MRERAILMGRAACVAILGAVCVPAQAQAQVVADPAVITHGEQDASQSAATSGDPASTAEGQDEAARDQGLQEIIVTARRRSESIQTVPVAVSVVTAEKLEQHQVLNAYQLVNLTPSLQVQSSNQQAGAVRFAVRGIGTFVFGPGIEQSVGIVVDDVVMSRPQFGNIQFFDLERVEVLRGPQGMLFGKNASAGLINIVTAQPRLNRTELLANVLYGNTSAPGSGHVATLQAAGNAPISGNSALRVAAFVTRQDAFVKDIALDQDLGNIAFGGRAKLLWEPSDAVRLTFAGDYQRSIGPGEGVLVRGFSAPGGLIATIDASNGVVGSPTNNIQATNIPNDNDSNTYGGSLKAEIELGGGYVLTNVLAHRRHSMNTSIDTDTTTEPLFDLNSGGFRYRQTTQELRLSSPTTDRLNYQVGLFYLDLRARQFLQQGASLGSPTPPGLDLLGAIADVTATTKSYAAFAEGEFEITEALGFTAGARYTHDVPGTHIVITNPAALIPIAPLIDFRGRRTHDDLSYRVGFNYDVTPDILTYATYARGYKGPTFDELDGTPVDEEVSKSFELGLKSTLLDRRLRLNVALFDTTFEGYQTQAQRPGSASGFFTINAGSLKTRGIEVEFTALPFEGLTISGGTTFLDTEYRDLAGIPCYYGQPTGTSGTNVCLPNGTTDVSGNQLALAPRWTTSITTRYEHPVSTDWVGFLQGDVYHRSSFNYTQTRDPQTRVGANALIGLSAGARTADDRLTITAFIRNLLDKRVPSLILADPVAGAYVGPTGLSDAALGGDYWNQFGPNSYRTIGISLNYRM